jgi:dTDP-4-amino-4,6-dideoxygalactose transaminase
MSDIQMVDLKNQYLKIKSEIDSEIMEVLESTRYIGGPKIKDFEHALAKYLDVNHVIACANGTDALQIPLMALGLKPGDEVIVPAFTYVATAEVIALLNLTPVMIDVEANSFNTNAEYIEAAITTKTRAVIPVHLFGQCTDMEDILKLCKKHNIPVIEDNAQAIGSDYIFSDGTKKKSGTMAEVGTTSFFPAKNLGCYGDGGAIMANDHEIAGKIRMIANHGQNKTYYHEVIGVNSRLDAIQAAVLNVKLKYLDNYANARRKVADIYDEAFSEIDLLDTPYRAPYSNHVFHQYTLKVKSGHRDKLKEHLRKAEIPSNIYYPVPLYTQNAFNKFNTGITLENTEMLCDSVLSLPIHTEMDENTQGRIVDGIKSYFKSI